MKSLVPRLFTTAVFVLASAFAGADDGKPASDWEKIHDKDGIALFRREVPGSDVFAFRGQGTIDAPLSKVASVIFDSEHSTDWIDNLVLTRRVRTLGPNEFIQYDHIGTPFVLKDRDFVSKVTIQLEPENHRITFNYQSVTDPDAPETKYVRGDLKKTQFTLSSIEGGAKTLVEGEIHCDPRGSVPKWIVNMFQRNWPEKSLKALRKQVARAEIKIDSRFAAFGDTPAPAAPVAAEASRTPTSDGKPQNSLGK